MIERAADALLIPHGLTSEIKNCLDGLFLR